MIRLKLGILLIAGLSMASAHPAAAQFGSIFGDPPRPPSDVPNRPPSPPMPTRQAPMAEPNGELQDAFPPTPPSARIQPQPSIRSQPLPPPAGLEPDEADAPVQEGALPRPPAAASPGPGQPPLIGLPAGQRQPRGTPQPANTALQSGDEIVSEPPKEKIANPTAVFSGLDKVTGRITSFDVAINETVQFGALQVTPRACFTRPPTETQNTDGFVEVDEVTLQGEIKRIFTGWMFAASPGLHGVEHAIYDVWLTDCKGGTTTVAGPAPPVAPAPAAPVRASPAARPPRPAPPMQPRLPVAPRRDF